MLKGGIQAHHGAEQGKGGDDGQKRQDGYAACAAPEPAQIRGRYFMAPPRLIDHRDLGAVAELFEIVEDDAVTRLQPPRMTMLDPFFGAGRDGADFDGVCHP